MLVYTAKIGIKINKTKVLCTYLCTRAESSSLKERCAGFCFAFTNSQKLVFHGFGGLEATFRLKFYDLFLSIAYYMLINFKKMLCKALYNKLLQRIKTLEKRLFECYKRLFECFFRLKKRLFECLRRHTFLNVVFNFYICEHSFCRF